MTFYYWLPNQSRVIKLPELLEAGLGYAVEDKFTARGNDSGPDGNQGVVVCHGDNRDGRLGYWPDKQVWKQIPGQDIWLGHYLEQRPKPKDLARAEQISGYWVRFDDGHQWLAPMARRWTELDDRLFWDYNLPRRYSLNDNAEWVPGDVKPKYERLWTLAMQYDDQLFDAVASAEEEPDGTLRFDFPEINTLAVMALQVNYRVGASELDMLGVYDESSRQLILDALLDNQTWMKWIKKKQAAAVQPGVSS
jgi:hypothetical protein